MESVLILQIKEDRIRAVKAHDRKTLKGLSILLGEIDRSRGTKDLTDELALSVVTKLCKAFEDNLRMCATSGLISPEDQDKLEVIGKYRPKTLTDGETRALVEKIKTELGTTDVSKIMAALKPFAPSINLRLASNIVRGL